MDVGDVEDGDGAALQGRSETGRLEARLQRGGGGGPGGRGVRRGLDARA